MNDKIESIKGIFGKMVYSKPFCYLLPFVCLGSYLLTQRIYPAGEYYLIQYLYTYDRGYLPRGLVGEVISWFTDVVTDDITKTVIAVFSWLLMITASLCIGKALSYVRKDKVRFCQALFILASICVLPFSFRLYFTDVRLDKLVWAVTLLAVFLSDRKYGIWLVPVLCVLATMINPIFVFTSMVLIAIILLQEFYSSGYSKKNLVICILSYVLIIALALYSPVSERLLGFADTSEIVDFYFARYAGELSEEAYNLFITEWLLDYFVPAEEVLETAYSLYFENGGGGVRALTFLLVVSIPIYLIFGILWKNAIKAEENKFQKFIYILCWISPIVIIPSIVISWDVSKYFGNNILTQLGLIAYFIVKDNAAVKASVNKIIEFSRKHIFVSACAVMYALLLIIN